jgi:hypothetical protein
MSENSENQVLSQNASQKFFKQNYLGLEWKDFLSLSIAGLALAISLWTSLAQYIDANVIKAKQHRQLSYVVVRIGKNIASAYSTYTETKGTVALSREGSLIASELASIGIRLRATDLDFTELHLTDTFQYSNATNFHAFEQVSDLLDAHYGADMISIFEATYFVRLAELALVTKPADAKGDDTGCGLWIVYASKAYDKIQTSYGLPSIADDECKDEIVLKFRKKLTAALKALEAAFANRTPLVGNER